MKRILLLALALSSCAPILSTLQSDDATLTRGGGVIVFSAGKTDAQDVAVYLAGTGLNIPGADCAPVGNGVGCKLGTVKAYAPITLTPTGTVLSGSATYYRPGNNRPYIAPLK